jgi:glycosyltransferase involved in cell wall biosynthesis
VKRPPRLTVGYLNPVGVMGGAETSLLILLAHLDREAVRPVLFCPPGELADRAAALDVDIRPWPLVRLRRHPPGACAAGLLGLARASAALLRHGADCHVLHANATAAALAAMPWRAIHRRPLIWHVRDLRLPRGAGRLLATGVDTALAISRAVADELRAAGFPASRLTALPNGLDPDTVRPNRSRQAVRAALGIAPEAPLALAVGQLVPWKGQDVLLQAFARIAAPEARLLVAGADLFGEHPAYAQRLAALADPRVRLLGPRADVPDLLGAADLLVLPSLGEPFGRVVLEAMAAALPVLATDAGGPRDIVVPGHTGWLVPPGDVPALAEALAAALALGADHRRQMGENGRRRLVVRYSPAGQAWRLAGVYARLSAGERA